MHRYSVFLPMLGEGSFGKVFRAKRKGSNEIVALKLIKKGGRTEKELQSLRKECEIQRHFKHPNIIHMLDSFETDGEIVVVTECAYIDLFRILATERSLTEDRAQKITTDLVSALHYLHSNRVLHRDLKPQNVLLSENGVVKLCDFGFARTMSLGTHVLTSIKGTPLYMAPELMEESPYDHTADLWSLGCIVYEMIVGSPPFKTNNILHLVKLIREEAVRWPSDTASPECLSLLQGLLEKDPSRRLTWPHLRQHPFVKGNVLITSEEGLRLPLTAELTSSQAEAKELQKQDLKAANQLTEGIGERRRKCLEDKGNIAKADFDNEDLIRRLKSMEMRDQTSQLNQQEVEEMLKLDTRSLSSLEADEWIEFLNQSISEVMDGETGSVCEQAFVDMVCRALTSSSPSLIQHIASLFSIPFAVDSSHQRLNNIRKAYAEVKLVPRLIYSTQLMVKRASPSCNLNAEELQALEVVLLLVSNLVHTDDVFLTHFCQISHLMCLARHYAFIFSLRRRKVRIATHLLAIFAHILRRMPLYHFVVIDFLKAMKDPEEELGGMMNTSSEWLALRGVVLVRELADRCTSYLRSVWTDGLTRHLHALRYSPSQELRSVAEVALGSLVDHGILGETRQSGADTS